MTLQGMAKHIELWLLDKLIPYARNPRTHSDAQIAQIAASIRAFRRVREMYGGRLPFDDLPNETAADARNRPLTIIDRLHRGRERVRLKYLQTKAHQQGAQDRPDDLPVKIER